MDETNYRRPRLRTVNRTVPPYLLNDFPSDFGYLVGKELIYLLATKGRPVLEGEEWEQIFANCIGAEWRPSNVGLDDITLGTCAWGAKTVKNTNPERCQKVRLISGRNSPIFSFGESSDPNRDPNELGPLILDIWNARVSAVRETHSHLRTVVLVKSDDLLNNLVFEFNTIRYDPELYTWRWNRRNNLEGFEQRTDSHRFTWQPHGSQFTIIESIPENSLLISIMQPSSLDRESILSSIGYEDSWVHVRTRSNND